MQGLPATPPEQDAYERFIDEQAELGLFAAGGPFESFPGAVLVVGRNGIVLDANRLAEPIVRLLQAGRCAELRDAVDVALDGKAGQVNPLLITEGSNSGAAQQAFDVIALPWAEAPAALLLGRDITLERSLRAALIESRQRYKDLVEAASDFAWETDSEGRFTFISADQAMGYLAADIVGRPAEDFMAVPDSADASPFTTRVPVEGVEVWMRRGDGETACLRVVALPLTNADNSWIGVRGQCRDVTHERTRQSDVARARHRERLFAHMLRFMRDELEPSRMLESMAAQLLPVLSASSVMIYAYYGDGAFTPIVGAGEALSEAAFGPLLARTAEGQREVIQGDESQRMIVAAADFRGDLRGALCIWQTAPLAASIEDERFLIGEMAAQVGAVLKQLAREQTLQHLSTTDDLTGLLNRRSFVELAEQQITEATAAGEAAALVYIDLDNFKQLNDLHGHGEGDELLARVGALLMAESGPRDLAVRFGGDEFGLLLRPASEEAALARGAALLREITGLADTHEAAAVKVTASIGIALTDPARAESLEALLQRADSAMYAAKRHGRDAVELAPPVESATS
jgi:diguanylate cyclase (GGDEF)-like protein/PAS domain S-box-containing protein